MAGIDPISNVASMVGTVADLVGKFVPDTNARAAILAAHQHDQAEYALAELAAAKEKWISETSLLQSQADVNKVEAGSSNIFVSGWRPFLGWGLSATFLIGCWALLVFCFLGKPFDAYQAILWIEISVLTGMLGLHTLERNQGVAPDQSPSGVPTPLPAIASTVVDVVKKALPAKPSKLPRA